MTEHRHALRRAEIEILVAVFVVDPAAFAAGDDDVAAPRGGAAEDPLLDFGVFQLALRHLWLCTLN